jgi:hypothetical protein
MVILDQEFDLQFAKVRRRERRKWIREIGTMLCFLFLKVSVEKLAKS